MTALIGIVVVHYGDPAATRRCLDSIAADPSRAERVVAVVDNSGDFDSSLLPPGVLLVPSGDNPGFGEGANRGFRRILEAHSPGCLVVLNHDVEIDAGFLDAACRTLSLPGTGAAGGPIRLAEPAGALWYAGGRIDYLTGTVRQSRDASDARRARRVTFIPGTALGMATAAWRQAGGFDRRFFLYNEDLDLCRRLHGSGWRLVFEPAMGCLHHLGAATGSAARSPLYLEHLAAGRLLPFRSRLYRAYLGLVHTPYVTLRSLILLARHGRHAAPRIRALMRGHCRALRSIFGPPGAD